MKKMKKIKFWFVQIKKEIVRINKEDEKCSFISFNPIKEYVVLVLGTIVLMSIAAGVAFVLYWITG